MKPSALPSPAVGANESPVSVVVTAYEQPETLSLVLLALARQSVPPAEVVVADDGSGEAVSAALRVLAPDLAFRLVHVWQTHADFRAARSRNNAIHQARGRLVAFLDQDTLPHRRWLECHLAQAGPGRMGLGYLYWLNEQLAPQITRAALAGGAFETWQTPADARALAARQRKYAWYAFLRRLGFGIKHKPKLNSCNFSAWREDLLRVNGFDEAFVGWGQEDDDLGRRLYGAGVRPVVLVDRALVAHIPHPSRRPAGWRQGGNVARLLRRGVPVHCPQGLDAHPLADVRVTVIQP